MSKLVEEWRPVRGYEGLYEVSDWGNVRSVDRIIKTKKGERHYKGKIIQFFKKEDDYLVCSLYYKGKVKRARVNRLVAEAFIPNPENKNVVDHINGERTNNRVENLRWCTQQENNNFELYREKKKNNPLISKSVYQYDSNNNLINIFPSTKEVERKLGIHSSTVSKWCLGKCNDKKGYKWSFNPL